MGVSGVWAVDPGDGEQGRTTDDYGRGEWWGLGRIEYEGEIPTMKR